MRMRNVCEKVPTLENLKEKFLLVKQSQHTGELAMRDYRNCLADFLKHSQNSVSYEPLEQDALRYFAAIPDTSPVRYNKPFQNVNAFFNWLVSQEYLSKNPLKANGLKKRKDDGNVKPASIEALQSFLKALDRKSYTGMRDYATTRRKRHIACDEFLCCSLKTRLALILLLLVSEAQPHRWVAFRGNGNLRTAYRSQLLSKS